MQNWKVLLDILALTTCALRIGAFLRLGLVTLVRQAGQRTTDFLVAAFQYEMTDLQRILGTAGNHFFLLRNLG